jgi:O-antigen/teichoic acid export membrane protein
MLLSAVLGRVRAGFGHLSGTGDFAGLARSSLEYIPSRVVPAFATVFSLGLAARVLGPASFGVFNVLVLSVAYATPIFGDWVVAGYQREAQANDLNRERYATTATFLIACLGAVVFSAIALALGLTYIALVGLLLPPTCLLRFQLGKLQMTGRSRAYSINQTVYSVAKAAAIGVSCVVFKSVTAMMASWILVTAAMVALGPRLHWSRHLNRELLGEFFRFGAPLVVVSLALNGLATVDRYILALLRTAPEVGIYSLAYAVADGTVLLLASVPALALYPQITALWDAGETGRVRHLVRSTLLYQTAGLTFLLVVAFSTAAVIPAIVGESYADSSRLFVILGGANVLAAASYVVSLGSSLRRTTRRLSVLYACAALGNIAITVPLVNAYGGGGAAAATGITYFGLLVAMARYSWPNLLHIMDIIAMTALVGVALVYGFSVPAVDGPRPINALWALIAFVVIWAVTRAAARRPAPHGYL